MAAEMVGSALAQEVVSGASSYISGKLEERASRAHTLARLEMALSQLEYALERAGKLPITYVSLLRRMRMLRRAAEKFLADVESGSPLQRGGDHTFRYPLLRHLLEGKTLCYETPTTTTVTGSRRHLLQVQQSLCIWPVRLEERGVEARLMYRYLSRERPERRFRLRLLARLSEDTDIVGVASKCLRSLTSQFKLGTASAVGELTMLPYQQDIAHSYGPPLDWTEETYVGFTKSFRPDPICCTDVVVSPHGVPEPVIAVGFGCYVSAPEYNNILDLAGSSSSSPSADNNAVVAAAGRNNAPPPLYMVAGLVPHDHHHRTCAGGAAPTRGIVLSYAGKEECLGADSVQQVKEVLRSKAIVDCVVGQPQATDYDVTYYAPHGFARIKLRKASDELAWTTTETTRAGKRKW